MKDLDPATVLEEAADLLLIRGVHRFGFGLEPAGPRCALGAIAEVQGIELYEVLARGRSVAMDVLDHRVWPIVWPERPFDERSTAVPQWNDTTTDDFEVIDTLRKVAKDIRNGEVQV